MKLSIVIVNYNVEYFLEQCLNSVSTALKEVEGEVWVVDNNSVDGSVEMIKQRFPWVNLIENKENVGFSKANNQAIRKSTGEYVLLLNPDTVVEEDTFSRCIEFMDNHPEAGGLGVKMLDGKGRFLPESKRGLPTPAVAFYKIFGLSRLFPRSRKFGRYHLGYLDKDETNEIEILSGAYMFMRKDALDKVGLLDEKFFMYGEDIDLSYRIVQGGYKNYYFPETRIIHYKGESTKKSSVNYVFVFYNAMIIFAKKHFSQKNARLFSFLINMAIYLRASMALVNRFIRKAIIPAVDAALILLGLYFGTQLYAEANDKNFPEDVINLLLPVYTGVWLSAVWLNGGYDKPVKLLKILRGVAWGTAVILMIYALLDKSYQFSRVIILLGGVWTAIVYLFGRWVYHLSGIKGYNLIGNDNKRFAIVGSKEEAGRVENLLAQTQNKIDFTGLVSPEKGNRPEGFLAHIGQLDQIVHIHKIDEVIFCAKDVPAQQIIDKMSRMGSRQIDFKIAQPESLYIIGSSSIDTSGDLYVLDINSVTRPKNRRNKRLLDVITSFLLILTYPFHFWRIRKKGRALINLFRITFGIKTFVGYADQSNERAFHLPKIKPGILSPIDKIEDQEVTADTIRRLNLIYAKDYRPLQDLAIIRKGFRHLGR